MTKKIYDYIIIGSGFGGSVSAMRLVEKGYSVLVLERGKRFEDNDFPRTNWNIFKYLWAPALRCFGILQFSLFKDILALHGSGVGGGSLGYANVLMVPNDTLFDNPAWKHLADWKRILQPHYETAARMLGIAANPQLYPSDEILYGIAEQSGNGETFQPVPVGVFFGKNGNEGEVYPDPYFGGQGPKRNSCQYCGGCMVGCRHNAKNTLVKNYLYFAEKWGAEVHAECTVIDIHPLAEGQTDGARYEILYKSSTAWMKPTQLKVRARSVIVAAGALGTLQLLLHCRDVSKSLPGISQRLGELVRTNSESLLGISARDTKVDYSKGLAITSIFNPDNITAVEPVRYPAGSDLIRLLSGPLLEKDSPIPIRILKILRQTLLRPIDFLITHVLPGWARRTTILLVMQTEDNRMRLRLGRSAWTLWRRGLVSEVDENNPIPKMLDVGHQLTQRFAAQVKGIPAGSINESLLKIPVTAHILGGCPFGRNPDEGVIDLDCQVHNHPGIYVIDGSIMPGNPGVNPSLTITALAEYAMSCVPPKTNTKVRKPLGIQN